MPGLWHAPWAKEGNSAGRWLTIEQLSDRLQVPIKTLRDWRYHGYGPQGVRLGRGERGAVRYRLSEVEQWEQDQEQAAGGAA